MPLARRPETMKMRRALSDKLPELVGVSAKHTTRSHRQALAACRTFSAAHSTIQHSHPLFVITIPDCRTHRDFLVEPAQIIGG